jgi:hypothetical protein
MPGIIRRIIGFFSLLREVAQSANFNRTESLCNNELFEPLFLCSLQPHSAANRVQMLRERETKNEKNRLLHFFQG